MPIGADVPHVFYVSPQGSDLNPGTRTRPWYSLAFATDRLQPGETLQLAAGEYAPATTGVLSVSCLGTARDGRPGAPITVRAETERAAQVRGDGNLPPLRLEGCAHWVVAGLVLANDHNADVPQGSDVGSVAMILRSEDVTLRRLVLLRSNNQRHSHLLRILGSVNVLAEECEGYDFYHNAFEAVGSDRVTFRRNYLNSRFATGMTGPPGSSARGDIGILIEESSHALLENNIAEVVSSGFAVTGQAIGSGSMSPYASQGARLYANLVRDALGFGFQLESRCDAASPCEPPNRVVSGALLVDNVVLQAEGGFAVNTAPDTRIENGTAAQVNHGYSLSRGSGNVALLYSAGVARSVARAFDGVGFGADQVDDWSFESCAVQSPGGHAVRFSPVDARITGPIEAPDSDACVAYLGAASSLRGAAAGADVGASVLYRTVDGALTNEPLWDPSSGAFPCGAVVAGINDDPKTSCMGASERFRIGTPECPLPYTQSR